MPENNKPIPKSILIFGAANHIGKPMAKFLSESAPEIKLRLASSNAERAAELQREFPNAEVVQANYYDQPSLEAAVDSIEGIYASVPLPVAVAGGDTTNKLIDAIKKSGTLIHMVHALGFQPEYNWEMLPEPIKSMMGGEYSDMPRKRALEASGLPITILNYGASFMDNIIYQMGRGIREERKMIWHRRKIPFIDPRDIGEVAARLLVSDNHRHIGLCHTLNNGNDFMRYSDVAEMMGEVYGEPVEFIFHKETFFKEYEPVFGPGVEPLWYVHEYDESIEVGWALNDFAERMLGRKPTTMREWLIEHRAQVLGE